MRLDDEIEVEVVGVDGEQEETLQGVVDVDAAVAEFHHLEQTIHDEQRKIENNDIEKGRAGGEGEWDIQEFFEDSVRKGEQTGHKLKRMGVIVENVTVVGLGADAASIPDNLDILKALWPPSWYVLILSIFPHFKIITCAYKKGLRRQKEHHSTY